MEAATALVVWQHPIFAEGPAPPHSRRLAQGMRRLARLKNASSGDLWFLRPAVLSEVSRQLAEESFAVIDGAFSDETSHSLRGELAREVTGAATGRVSAGGASALRSDISTWVSPDGASERSVLAGLVARVDGLVLALRHGANGTDAGDGGGGGGSHLDLVSRQLSGVRRRSEPMVACYPPTGSKYVRHVDNSCAAAAGSRCNGRRLTAVSYANPPRSPSTDGALRIFRGGSVSSEPRVDLEPIHGRLVLPTRPPALDPTPLAS